MKPPTYHVKHQNIKQQVLKTTNPPIHKYTKQKSQIKPLNPNIQQLLNKQSIKNSKHKTHRPQPIKHQQQTIYAIPQFKYANQLTTKILKQTKPK